MILLQYNIEKKVNEEEEDDDSDFEGSKNVEDDLDGMARKFWNLCERLKLKLKLKPFCWQYIDFINS